MENFESNSDQITHLANNSIEAKREQEAVYKRTAEHERARKEEQEKECARKDKERENLKEKKSRRTAYVLRRRKNVLSPRRALHKQAMLAKQRYPGKDRLGIIRRCTCAGRRFRVHLTPRFVNQGSC
ncbi:uncharacterized protein BJ212DRAFT_527809 [Suillus subaureus]|uniref:Uncharacterized protein n=1 Tax=Suillus subaureus TaxID=48587 RepID=A0A9P7EKR1_9AGAM|nr:uncharacterized protein BJ212DRAFT_527809 [Suillus subaureus]KAG1824449.1 hypothetical protein BJ212DRAFT_527809 [Suillus subaureus]